MALESWNEEQTNSGKLKQMFKIAEQMVKERKEVTVAKYIKDERKVLEQQRKRFLRGGEVAFKPC